MSDIDRSGEYVKLLGEIGLLAAYRGNLHEAENIAVAIEQKRPNAFISFLTRAVICLQCGKYEEAIELLETQLSVTENSQFAQNFIYLFVFFFRGADGLSNYLEGSDSDGQAGDFQDDELVKLIMGENN